MNSIAIKINPNDLQNVKDMLADFKGAGERVTVRALNKTLTGVRTDSSAVIRTVVTAKKSAVDETFKISKASTGKPSAYIASTGKPLALVDYSTRQTKKGVSVQVRKDRQRKIVPGAFEATMKSGHKGIFWRQWHNKNKAKMSKTDAAINRSGWIWSRKRQRFINVAWLPREYRLPMKELYGPRIPDIMSNDPVMNKILLQSGQRLHDNLMHETEYELSKHK